MCIVGGWGEVNYLEVLDARDGDNLVVTRLAGEVRGRVRRNWGCVYGDHVSDCAGRVKRALNYIARERGSDANSVEEGILASLSLPIQELATPAG